jgi:hypothetical protein
VNSEVRLLRTPTFDLDYRLCRCEGFRVESPRGREGVVEEVHFGSRIDRPDAIVVRSGLLRRRLLIPVDEVAEVVLREERVVLARAPERKESDALREVLNRLGAAASAARTGAARGR